MREEVQNYQTKLAELAPERAALQDEFVATYNECAECLSTQTAPAMAAARAVLVGPKSHSDQ